MIKVCLFITELSIGGAQTALLQLLQHLDRGYFEPNVVCLYNGDGTAGRQITALGIPVEDLGMRSKLDIRALFHLYRYLKREQPQILHCWMFHANIPGRVLGRLAGVPVIITSERTMGQESLIRRWINAETAKWADKVTCVSEQVAEYARASIGIPPEKLTVIPNGVDFEKFQGLKEKAAARRDCGLPDEGVLVGAIGRPRAVKGYADLIKAWGNSPANKSRRIWLWLGMVLGSVSSFDLPYRCKVQNGSIF